jgi:predicted RNA-binding Zn-ribbon protein involved in translation (DUF1610 family)
VRLLHEKGYRYCRNCHYDLRSLQPETDTCPECGTYISHHFTGDVETAPPVMARVDHMPRLGSVAMAHGVELSPAQVEQAWMMQRKTPSARERRRDTILVCATLLAVVVCAVLLDLWLEHLFPQTPSGVIQVAAFGVFAGIWVAWFWTCLWRSVRKTTRRTREALRQMGIELCVHCGQYLGDLDSTVKTCPRCRRPRATLPETAPIDSPSSTRP